MTTSKSGADRLKGLADKAKKKGQTTVSNKDITQKPTTSTKPKKDTVLEDLKREQKKAPQQYQSVKLKAETYRRMDDMAIKYGTTVGRVIDKVLKAWLDEVEQ